MSIIDQLKWAFDARDVAAPEKSVLVALAFRANSAAQCWPSLEEISQMTGLATSTVCRAIQRLIESKYVVRSRRFGQSSVYEMQFSRPSEGVVAVQKSPKTTPEMVGTSTLSAITAPAAVMAEKQDSNSREATTLPSFSAPPVIAEEQHSFSGEARLSCSTSNIVLAEKQKKNLPFNLPFNEPFNQPDTHARTKTKAKVEKFEPDPTILTASQQRRDALARWLDHKKLRGERYTERGWKTLTGSRLDRFTDHQVVEAIDTAIERNWAGFFPEKITATPASPQAFCRQPQSTPWDRCENAKMPPEAFEEMDLMRMKREAIEREERERNAVHYAE